MYNIISDNSQPAPMKLTDNHSINCYYTNAHSLYNKLYEVKALVEKYQLKIVGITETWGCPEIFDAEYHLTNFEMYRKDRKVNRGGGVILYVHESLTSVPCSELNEIDFGESVWSIVKLNDDINLLVGVVYRSPNSENNNNEKLLKLLALIRNKVKITNVLIMGDFNLPEIDYNNYVVEGDEDSYAMRFF